MLNVPQTCWLHPSIHVGPSLIEGSGLFASEPMVAGAIVVTFGGTLVTTAELRELFGKAETYVDTISVAADRHLVLCSGQPVRFGNHSCDPSAWHVDAFTLALLHDVSAGDEITVDYATQTTDSAFRLNCRCGASGCRGTVSGDDWRDPWWQQRFAGHVVPAVAAAIQ